MSHVRVSIRIRVKTNLNDHYELLNTTIYFKLKGRHHEKNIKSNFVCIRVYGISLRCRHVREAPEANFMGQKTGSKKHEHWTVWGAMTKAAGHTATKIPFMYSQKRNCAPQSNVHIHVSVSDSYIFPGSVHIFSCSRIGRRIVGIQYINRSQTHECGNFDWGRAIPFLWIFVSNFRYCVFAVHATKQELARSGGMQRHYS